MGYMRDAAGRRLDSIAIPSAAEIAAAYAQKAPRKLMVLGDSITYLDAGLLSEAPDNLRPVATAYRVDGSKVTGMYAWANAQLGHPLIMAGNAGVPGDTTEQMFARLGSVLAIPSDIVGVQGGANDFTAGWDASRTIAALGSIYAGVLTSGRRLLALTTMSRSTMNTTAGRLYLGTVNRWIKNYARTTPGVILADVCSAQTDPATGIPYVAPFFTTSDGTHPNAIGAQRMGKVIADALRPHVTQTDIFSSNNLDPLNFMRNACNTGTTGTVTAPITGTPGTLWSVGWSGGTAVATVSKVARTDNLPGEWTRVVIGNGNTSNIIANGSVLWDNTGANGVKVGDTITCAVEVRTTGLVGVSQFRGGSYHSVSQGLDLNGAWNQGNGTIMDATYVLMVDAVVIQAGATFLGVQVSVTATGGTFDIGRAAVMKTS